MMVCSVLSKLARPTLVHHAMSSQGQPSCFSSLAARPSEHAQSTLHCCRVNAAMPVHTTWWTMSRNIVPLSSFSIDTLHGAAGDAESMAFIPQAFATAYGTHSTASSAAIRIITKQRVPYLLCMHPALRQRLSVQLAARHSAPPPMQHCALLLPFSQQVDVSWWLQARQLT